MALEYKLSYTASEIDKKLTDIDEISASLALKADIIDGKIPLEQLPDDIGGGLTEVSWKDIKDKPFYEIGFSYEWDGNKEGLENFNAAGAFDFYKVSSDAPSKEELTGTIISSYFDGDLLEGAVGTGQIADFIDTNNGNFAILFGGQLPIAFIASVAGEDSAMGTSFEIPSAGLWFMSANEGEYTHYIKSAENLVKTLDKKFLPDDIGGGVTSWDDLKDRPFYNEGTFIETPSDISGLTMISSQPLEIIGGISFTFVKVGNAFSTPEETYGALIKVNSDGQMLEFVVDDSYVNYLDNGFALISFNNGFYPLVINANAPGIIALPTTSMMGEDLTFNVTEAGLYFLYLEGMGAVNSYSKGELKQLDKKFIPSDIGTWEAMPDKPFGESKSSITWDGTPMSEVANANDLEFHKASDMYFDAEDLIGSTFNLFLIEENTDITEIVSSDSIMDLGENCFGISSANLDGMPAILITSSATVVEGVELPSAGIWFLSMPDICYTSYLEMIQIKKLDEKYLPDDIGGGVTSWNDLEDKPFYETGWSIGWDGNTEGLDYVDLTASLGVMLYNVAEPKTREELIGVTVKYFYHDNPEQIIEFVITENHILNTSNDKIFLISDGNDLQFGVALEGGSTTLPMFGDFPLELQSAGIWIVVPFNYTVFYIGNIDIKKIDKKYLPDDIGSGVSSWNDLEDKPFYETGWAIEWDTNPTDTFVPIEGSDGFYKVSDIVPTKDELIGATLKAEFDGESIDMVLSDSDIVDYSADCYGFANSPFFVVTTQATEFIFMGEVPISFPSPGVWFIYSSGVTWAYYLGKGELKQLDPKFIPNYFGEVGFYTDCDISNATTTVSVPVNEDEFGMSELRFFKFSEPINDSIKGYLLSVLMDGENMEIPMGDEDRDASIIVSDTGSEYTLYALNIKTNNEIVNMEDFGLPIFTVAEAGLYVLDVSLIGGQINYFKSPDYNMIKIDKKFIPDDITAAVSITYDEFPIEGSQNPVKSAGIHSAISALESKVTSAFCYKGTVKDYSDLPIEGNSIGDVWNIANADETNEVEAGDNAAWDGESWDILAGVIDLSNYYTKEEINTLIGNCDTVISSINTLIGGV
jgi:hypothetical protein